MEKVFVFFSVSLPGNEHLILVLFVAHSGSLKFGPSNNSYLDLFPSKYMASWVETVVKSLPANAGDLRDPDSIPRSGRSHGGWHSNPLQYSCQENPMDRGAWWAMVHGVAKSWTWLK